jgi:hypothetical protein
MKYLSSLVVIGIPMGTNCIPLLAGLFQHTYEAHFFQWLLKNKDYKKYPKPSIPASAI